MPRECDICGKKTIFGRNISHAHNVSSRTFIPNLQRVRVQVPGGNSKRARLCTRCIRSGAVMKAAR